MLIKNNIRKTFKNKEQFRIGKMAIKGGRIAKIATEESKSRKYVYEQKNKLEAAIDKIGDEISESKAMLFKIDDGVLTRIIIGLALFCSSGIEGIQTFIEEIFKIHISVGKISGIINEAAKRAKEFDKTVKLNLIEAGANDEVFQCNEPVLVGADPLSTYIYLMTPANNRSAQTWENAFEEQKKAGLLLKMSVNDAGAGLNKGLKAAFPGLEIQADVFHAIHPIGKAIVSLEKKHIMR